MKKRTLALALCGAMVLSLAGCKKTDAGNQTTAANEVTEAAGSTESAEGLKDTTPVTQQKELSDYSSFVTLGQYTGLDVEVSLATVTDQDIKDYEDQVVYYYNTYLVKADEIKEGVTKVGDTINLDYSGMLDGVAFDGGTAKSQSYTVGSGRFISDLDTQLAGLEVGKEYELPCKFPDEYGSTDLAGKEVVFVVTVNYIEGEKPVYEWNDELVELYTNGDFKTTADYEQKIAADLLQTAQNDQQTEYRNSLWNTIVDGCEFNSLPEDKVAALYDNYLDYYNDYFEYYASMYGTDKETFLSQQYQMTQEDLEAQCREMAENEVKFILAGCEIYRAQGNVMTDELYNQKAQEIAAQYGYDSAQAFIDEYGEDYVKESFVFDIITEYVVENNNMKEKNE